jgi:hypothetical protein
MTPEQQQAIDLRLNGVDSRLIDFQMISVACKLNKIESANIFSIAHNNCCLLSNNLSALQKIKISK